MMGILRKIFGTKNERELKRIQPWIDQCNQWEDRTKALSDDALKNQTVLFRERLSKNEPLNSLLPEAFATVREAARREIGQRHYDVQLIGGVFLHEGKISEMKTGEGKTLTATAPVYLNALLGRGVHVVTVNDYLATRDSQWMGKIYARLGMTTGNILHGLSDTQRRDAYGFDITYGTNNEFGFDYLRDNMKTDLSRFVQRGHYFAIVDEVDSILIDEARTPLIISGPADTSSELYVKCNSVIPGLQKDSDYTLDEKSRTVALTEDGISKVEKRLAVENLYDPRHIDYLHHVQQALKAHIIFKKDVDYVVRDGKVIIVDEFTGRLMPGRRYSDGLHGALEAKEHVAVEKETQTMATVTFQNYFRLYEKLAGMTGTADTEAVEFKKIYNLDVAVIPTNKKMIRQDDDDVVYRTAREKFNAIADDIAEMQKKGQPILVGTVSVEKSELLSSLLNKRGIQHDVLNAKNHAREASIIENAGQRGNVTISTNMAGRGTDIVLGSGVADLGGLYVIGTERHESRRIDNQLRGRSGRQGDQGKSCFYLSLEDDLMRIFASDRLSAIMQRLGMKDGESIVSPMVSRAIERAQRRVEEQNFSSRKHLLEYDDVMNQQRKIIYARRRAILEGKAELDFFENVVATISDRVVEKFAPETSGNQSWEIEQCQKELQAEFNTKFDFANFSFTTETSPFGLSDLVKEQVLKQYHEKKNKVGGETMKKIEHFVHLQIIDGSWKEHLLAMDHLKDSVSLRGYGQRDPLQEYKKEAFRLFESLMFKIEDETVLALVRMPTPTVSESIPMAVEEPDESELQFRHPSSSQAPVASSSSNTSSSSSTNNASSRSRRQQEAPPKVQPFHRPEAKVGRNDVCPCGSGKKYKKCHGASQESSQST